MDVLECAKAVLPRDVYLKIIGLLGMEWRIMLGLVRKIRVPEGLEGRLRLARPVRSGLATLLRLGYDASIADTHAQHKVMMFYREYDGHTDVGVLTQKTSESDGRYITEYTASVLDDPCKFKSPIYYYT